jgi:hypothetical protein
VVDTSFAREDLRKQCSWGRRLSPFGHIFDIAVRRVDTEAVQMAVEDVPGSTNRNRLESDVADTGVLGGPYSRRTSPADHLGTRGAGGPGGGLVCSGG